MVVQGLTYSFMLDLLIGSQNLVADSFMMALYAPGAALPRTIAAYTPVGEIVHPAYTAGGKALSQPAAPTVTNGVAHMTFNTTVWVPAGFTAAGALIYNATRGGRSVAVLNFGGAKESSAAFTVQMPPAGPETSLIRLA